MNRPVGKESTENHGRQGGNPTGAHPGSLGLERRVHQGNSNWVPGLVRETIRVITGRAPFSPYIEQQAFLAEQGGEPVARVCAFVNRHYLEYHGENTGFFGYFEALPGMAQAVEDLLGTALRWLEERGMKAVVGPINGDIFHGFALQVDALDQMPIFPYASAQPYYQRYLEDSGAHVRGRPRVCERG